MSDDELIDGVEEADSRIFTQIKLVDYFSIIFTPHQGFHEMMNVGGKNDFSAKKATESRQPANFNARIHCGRQDHYRRPHYSDLATLISKAKCCVLARTTA